MHHSICRRPPHIYLSRQHSTLLSLVFLDTSRRQTSKLGINVYQPFAYFLSTLDFVPLTTIFSHRPTQLSSTLLSADPSVLENITFFPLLIVRPSICLLRCLSHVFSSLIYIDILPLCRQHYSYLL
ncbi:hypothetical protein BC826DRAFT_1048647 [Russula brevipes]|nr:hypothetical protein BC826DRAFT_1048647 [Russula brevipes]